MFDGFGYALVVAIVVGLSAGYLGSLMVLKRMALVGDALSHVALPGIALGILFKFDPFLGAFAFLFASAVITWQLERITRLAFEALIGTLFTLSLALGIILVPEPDLLEALFGDITKVTVQDAITAIVVSLVAVYLTRLIYDKIVLGMISEDLATSTGVNVPRVNLAYLLLVSLIVAIGIKIVGTLLVGVLVIIPAATAKNIATSMSRYALYSSVFGVVGSVSGVLVSGFTGLPAGPMVVVIGFAIFLIAVMVKGYTMISERIAV